MNQTELRLQANCNKWFHNRYPELRGLLCYNLNNSTGIINSSINKVMGLQAGRSDMTLYYKGTAVFIEFKTATGAQSEEQKEWQKKIEKQGFKYYIIRSLDELRILIENILGY